MEDITFARWSLIFFVILSFISYGQCKNATKSPKEKVYIVETDPARNFTRLDYVGILHKIVSNRRTSQCLLYVYKFVLSGFAARLTEIEATKLASVGGVLAVIPDTSVEVEVDDNPELLAVAGNGVINTRN